MKQLITFCLLFVHSCGNISKHYPIDGKWRYINKNKGCEIIFKNGVYNITRWNDDLVNTSKGKYFFNENKARNKITVTLVPDLQYVEGDTIILPCESIDIVSITDSILATQQPTQWVHGFEAATERKNYIELYRKVKK